MSGMSKGCVGMSWYGMGYGVWGMGYVMVWYGVCHGMLADMCYVMVC